MLRRLSVFDCVGGSEWQGQEVAMDCVFFLLENFKKRSAQVIEKFLSGRPRSSGRPRFLSRATCAGCSVKPCRSLH